MTLRSVLIGALLVISTFLITIVGAQTDTYTITGSQEIVCANNGMMWVKAVAENRVRILCDSVMPSQVPATSTAAIPTDTAVPPTALPATVTVSVVLPTVSNTPPPPTATVPAATATRTRTATNTRTPTGIPPTNVPPTAIPPTAVPPTAIPPTAVIATATLPTGGNVVHVNPSQSIQAAVNSAAPGTTIRLADGVYNQRVLVNRSGITFEGSRAAIVRGNESGGRIFEVFADNTTFRGFTIDGQYASNTYSGRAIYILGQQVRNGVDNVLIENMKITNQGGECIRLRYYAQNIEIRNNEITNCGRVDYPNGVWAGGGKNGEGIYVGTAPEQQGDGKNPESGPDISQNIRIHHNVFNTQGNECVDIKENSTNVVVSYNDCTGQKDENSAGMDSRGNGNTFEYNTIYGNVGAGIRYGGDTSGMGINNVARFNTIRNNQQAGIKVQRTPQGTHCGNIITNNAGGVTSGGSVGDPQRPC